METEAEVEIMQPQVRQHLGCQRLEQEKRDPPWRHWREHGPADTFTSGSWLPELWESKFLFLLAALGSEHNVLLWQRGGGVSFPEFKSWLHYSWSNSKGRWGDKWTWHLKGIQTRAWPPETPPKCQALLSQGEPFAQHGLPRLELVTEK